MTIDEAASEFSKRLHAEIDKHLIDITEGILGRVPTNDEIGRRMNRAIHHDGEWEYKWDGKTILHVMFPRPLEAVVLRHEDV